MKVISILTNYGVVDRRALAHFELNLTPDDSRIYHFRRWDEANLAQEHSFRHRNKKAIPYQSVSLAGVVWSVLTPERDLNDRLAGTYLVLR
jgi:hypothetical protein